MAAAVAEDVDVVGLSILSGSHRALVPRILDGLRAAGLTTPVVVGGIVPEGDARLLLDAGVRAIYTPKDFSLRAIMADLLDVVESATGAAGDVA